MLELSRKSDYALRAILFLARLSPNRYSRVGEIAKAHEIPRAFLAQILPLLVNRGVVKSQQGARGGYSLARAPDEISFLEVIEAVEGPLRLNKCTGDPHQDCSILESCEMHSVWSTAQKRMVDFLHNVSMADVLAASHHRQESPMILPRLL